MVLGVAGAVFLTIFYQNWKFGILLPGLGVAVGMLAIWNFPESPRWLMQTSSFEAGQDELKKVRRT